VKKGFRIAILTTIPIILTSIILIITSPSILMETWEGTLISLISTIYSRTQDLILTLVLT
jgi:hypothetical protein